MIKITIRCDLCKKEEAEFQVRHENDVFAGIRKSGFLFVQYEGKPEKLLGPLCFAQYQDKLKEADAAKDKVISDWYNQERANESNPS
jgi:hypothetical protein